MPEAPELHLAARFITSIGQRTLFGGQVVKSAVSKNPDVAWDKAEYRVQGVSRGKELKVLLTEGAEEAKGGETLSIIFRFGMSGSFKYTSVADLPKHAHLQFYTINEPTPMVLSFVDYRRFGRWKVGADWGPDRGPDPLWEYPTFRSNVLENLKSSAFNKPICEAMLNQKFFNGIGNYLRAEILYRCGTRPFDEAREVLSELKPFSKWYESQVKEKDVKEGTVKPDLLDLCHILPNEVINLSGDGQGYDVNPDADEEENAALREWLQCYYQDGMKNVVDHNGRTMWFAGEPGRLKPKEANSRNKIVRSKMKKKQEKETAEQNSVSEETVAKTNKRHARAKTVASMKLKETEAVKTEHIQQPVKSTRSPRNAKNSVKKEGPTVQATRRSKNDKKKDVKEEGSTGPVRAKRMKREGSTTPAAARKVENEQANTEPRRRSTRIRCP